MNDNKTYGEKTIYSITIDAPIEKVWNELVKTDTVLPFFFGAVCDTPGLEPGAPIAMRTKDGKNTSVVGEVLEFNPPYRYAHTFKFTYYEDPPCKVTYDLKEVDGGTEFTLITENAIPGSKTEKEMARGSTFIGTNLKALVETGKPLFLGKFVMFIGGLTGFMMPKEARSENWSFDDILKLGK
ncbi:MAG: hypothetical protein Pars2KO_13590 [Parasphingorhabdus sp.]